MAGLFDKAKKVILDAAKNNTVIVHKEYAAQITQPIARDTPVKTGRATAGWQGDINKEPTPDNNVFDKSPSAKPTIDRLRRAISGLKYKDEIIIKNAVSDDEGGDDYIIKLEDGGSAQAPTGMFMKNVVKYKQIAKKTKKKLGL
jgi:hypothetical protein